MQGEIGTDGFLPQKSPDNQGEYTARSPEQQKN